VQFGNGTQLVLHVVTFKLKGRPSRHSPWQVPMQRGDTFPCGGLPFVLWRFPLHRDQVASWAAAYTHDSTGVRLRVWGIKPTSPTKWRQVRTWEKKAVTAWKTA